MYESFFGLKERPFSLLPDPGFLFLSTRHRMALTLLEYGLMNQAGFTVVTGDIGTGKTTLIRHMLGEMGRDTTVGLISNTHSSFGELLQWILMAFNLEHKDKDKVSMYQTFVDFIIDEYSHRKRTVLIVDEAQNLLPETLEELRMLSNINADKHQLLQVILVGQPGLRDMLRRPDLEQFAQRITVDYNLEPLSAAETAEYIRHRVEIAGGDPDLFDVEACEIFHRYSGGTPRLINLLCDTALVYGYAEQLPRINAQLAGDVARDKAKGGIFPSRYHDPDPDTRSSGDLPADRSTQGGPALKKSIARDGDKSTPSSAEAESLPESPVDSEYEPHGTGSPLQTHAGETRDVAIDAIPFVETEARGTETDTPDTSKDDVPAENDAVSGSTDDGIVETRNMAVAIENHTGVPTRRDDGLRRGGRISRWWASATAAIGSASSSQNKKAAGETRHDAKEPVNADSHTVDLTHNKENTVMPPAPAARDDDYDAAGAIDIALPEPGGESLQDEIPDIPTIRTSDVASAATSPETGHTSPVDPPLPPSHRNSVWRKKLRIAIASDSIAQRNRLRIVLEKFGMEIVATVGLYEEDLRSIPRQGVDVVLVDLDENIEQELYFLDDILGKLDMPILFSDSSAPHNNADPREFEKRLTLKLFSLMRSAS